jgi:hypothetical protein
MLISVHEVMSTTVNRRFATHTYTHNQEVPLVRNERPRPLRNVNDAASRKGETFGHPRSHPESSTMATVYHPLESDRIARLSRTRDRGGTLPDRLVAGFRAGSGEPDDMEAGI